MWQETLISLDFCWWPQGASQNAYEKSGILWSGRGLSGLHWIWRNGRGPNLEWRQETRAFSPFLTPIAGSLPSRDKRVTPRLLWRNGSPLTFGVVHGMTGHLPSCVWNLRVFPDDARGCQCPFVLCLHPQGFLRRGVWASVSFQERPGNRGQSACVTTNEATSRISS